MTWDRIAGYGFLTTALGTVVGAAAALLVHNALLIPFTVVCGAIGSTVGWYFCVYRRLRGEAIIPPRLASQSGPR
ncbi:MAG: hypothetical protein WCF16_13145 [Alphaproteobacteria bacterium]